MTNRSADIGASGVTSVMDTERYRPYPTYKDSGIEWLGEIPAHWEVSATKRVCRIVNGATPKSAESSYWNGDIPWITPEDLGYLDQGYILSSKRKITWEGYQDCGTTMVPVGSLVLSTRAPIGHLGIANVKLCTNQGCRSLAFRYKHSEVYYFFQFSACRVDLEALGQGSTFSELSNDKLGDFEIAIPPLPEQRAIAAFLDRETAKIDALVAKKERLIELLQEKRTALISDVVTKGLDPDVPLKDFGVEWLGEIPAHWEVRRLKHTVNKIGSGKTPSGGAERYVTDGIMLLRSQNVHFRGLELSDVAYIDKATDDEMSNSRVCEDDVLLNITGASLGRCCVARLKGLEANVNQHVCIIRPDQRQSDPVFLAYSIESQSLQDQIFNNENGVSRDALNFEQIGSLILVEPTIIEQRAIAAFLDHETANIDALIAKVQEAIDRLKELRTALISAAVTGKIDVRKAAA